MIKVNNNSNKIDLLIVIKFAFNNIISMFSKF